MSRPAVEGDQPEQQAELQEQHETESRVRGVHGRFMGIAVRTTG